MSKKTLAIYKKFQNKWVALNKKADRVLAVGSDIIEVENKLKKENLFAYEIKFILPLDRRFAP